jgi:hypothetical protein
MTIADQISERVRLETVENTTFNVNFSDFEYKK